MRNHILLFGPPGSGKDTQGKILSKVLNIPLISSGDALREEIATQTKIGLKFEQLIKNGLLVPDEVMYEFFKTVLAKYNLKEGFIFNGFPRTVSQAQFLSGYLESRGTNYDCVLYLNIEDSEIIKRISGRLICKNCDAVYNIYFNPPKSDMECDACGGELYKRADDEETIVKRRLDVYYHDTAPLVEYFRSNNYFFEIDGSGTESHVTERLLGVVL